MHRPSERPLRVVHCPVNTAGVPWTNVQALRRRGVDARARRLRPVQAAPRGRLVARPAQGLSARPDRPVARARAPAPAHRRLPLLLRAHARAEVAPVPDPARVRQEVGLALPRLRHPRQDARAARVRQEGGRRGRRQLRRDPLGAGGRGDPARHRRALASRPHRRPTARGRVVVHAPSSPRPQGHRARDRGVCGARRRPRARRGAPPRRGVRALPGGRHRRRPAERRLVRPLRDRVHGARQAGRHVPPRRGGSAHGGGLRRPRAARVTRRPRRCATACARSSPPPGRAAPDRSREPRLRRARSTTSSAIADRLLDLYSRL